MTWVLPTALYWDGRIRTGVALRLHQGRVVELTERAPPDAQPISGLLTPSWINAHTHLELSHYRAAPGLGMRAFIRAMSPKRGQASPETIAQVLSAALSEGTTGFVSHQNTRLPPEAIPPGVQVWLLAEFFGLKPSRSNWRSACTFGYPRTPHSLYALSRLLWRRARRPSSFPKSLHFLESLEERLWLLEGRGAFRPFLMAFHRKPYRPKLWHSLRLLSRRAPALWLVHATEAPPTLLEAVLNRFSNVYLVLCPLANAHITRRQPPLRFLRQHADRILLGTDSLANSASLSLWPVVRHLVQSGWPWEKVLLAAADTPRRWLPVASDWAVIAPLSSDLTLSPLTRAYRPGIDW